MTTPTPDPNRERQPHRCWDCDGWGPSYMVHNHVWEAAFPDYRTIRRELLLRYKQTHPERCHVLLCFTCIERRLGRRLTIEDFTPAPINDAIRFAHRMGRTSTVTEAGYDLKYGWLS